MGSTNKKTKISTLTSNGKTMHQFSGVLVEGENNPELIKKRAIQTKLARAVFENKELNVDANSKIISNGKEIGSVGESADGKTSLVSANVNGKYKQILF